MTTTVPNFVRGSLVLLTFILTFFRKSIGLSLVDSCVVVGVISISLAFYALSRMKETYDKELNYIEIM